MQLKLLNICQDISNIVILPSGVIAFLYVMPKTTVFNPPTLFVTLRNVSL